MASVLLGRTALFINSSLEKLLFIPAKDIYKTQELAFGDVIKVSLIDFSTESL